MNTPSWIGFAARLDKPTSTASTRRVDTTRLPVKLGRIAASAFLALACSLPAPAMADCFDDAAQYHGVNPWILRAIAAIESSFNPTVKHPLNSDGSVDEGMMGINSVHAPDLARYGVNTGDMRDGCKSVFLGAWHLRNRINESGNTWQGLGTYHSKTPSKRDAYAAKVRRIIEFWIEKGIIPR